MSYGTRIRCVSLGVVCVAAGWLCGPPCYGQGADVPVLVVYDVSDLVRKVPDFPAPRLGLSGLEPPGSADIEDEDQAPLFTTDELVELIRKVVLPESWNTAGVEIRGEGSSLVIVQPPAAQMEIARTLASLERAYRVEARLIAADEKVLATCGFRADGPDHQQLPRAAVARALDDSPATEPEFSLVLREGQRSHSARITPILHVSGVDKDATGRVADPVIDTLLEGVVFEAEVRTSHKPDYVHLYWSLNEADGDVPCQSIEMEGVRVAETTLVKSQRIEGSVLLSREKALIVRFQRLRAAVAEPTLLVVTCTRVEP